MPEAIHAAEDNTEKRTDDGPDDPVSMLYSHETDVPVSGTGECDVEKVLLTVSL
jgi:hypothetical protein